MKPAMKPALVDPIVAFRARCEARALLYRAGELRLHEAVDGLQNAAEEASSARSARTPRRRSCPTRLASSESWKDDRHAET
jgi:hypothetical protein